MPRIIALLTALAAIIPAALQAAPEIGMAMPLPDYKMMDVSGREIAYADIKGEKATVVVFWCNHCPFVVRWRSRMVAIAKDYQDKGIGFLAVNSNDPKVVTADDLEAMKRNAKEFGYTFAYTVDEGSRLAKALGATHTPHVFVFNPENKLIYVGAIDDNSNDAAKVEKHHLRSVLDAVLAGRELPATTSRALGCTIKWYK